MAKAGGKGWFARGLRDLYQFATRGVVELQNAVYAESNVAIPSVVTSAQLQSQYEAGLDASAGRAAEPEKASELER
jgi:hypothetical protein